MRCRNYAYRSGLFFVVMAAMLLLPWQAFSQNTATDNGLNQSGVYVDAEGVLHRKTFVDPGGQLTRERIAAAKSTLDPKVTTKSKLRKISLNRLEASIREHQGVLSEEMRSLAGLQRIQYIFFYPETKDIVLAGPAEGWITNVAGRIVGMTTGRPVVQLQDLVVALRAYPPSGHTTQFIGCSIDPTPEGLAAMQQFLNSIHPAPNEAPFVVEGLRTKLGLQNISVNGISPKTHFAQVIVEADYRMKLIGLGLEKPAVKFAVWVDRVRPGDLSRNALQRWFFTPDYQCVRVSSDNMAMELVGDGVKLVGESEMVATTGQRQVSGGFNKASQEFVTGFTKAYPQLAERSPIYADLRNVIDCSIAAAYIQQQDFYGKSGWMMDFLGDEKSFPVEIYDIPKTVETVVSAFWRGNTLMTPVGGGVEIQPQKALESDKLLSDEKGKLAKTHEETKIDLAKGQWWWD